jgi:hypothetical protein
MNNFLSSMLASVSGFFTKAGAYIARKTKGLNEAYAAYERSQAPRLSIKEQMFFFKRLSFLITAGVPILECLTMIAESSASPRYKRVVNSVIADVANGSSLAKSLARFPDIFGDFGINLIKIGESSGTLSQNLEYLADELYKRNNLQSKVASAFVYPAVITHNAMQVFLRVVSPLPTGIKGYDLVTQTRRSGPSVVVPWIMDNCSGFGFYKRSVIRYVEENGDFKLYSLRWLTNIEELLQLYIMVTTAAETRLFPRIFRITTSPSTTRQKRMNLKA